MLLGIEHGDLGGALDRLLSELRALIRATAIDGLTVREAAKLLGIAEGTAVAGVDGDGAVLARLVAGGDQHDSFTRSVYASSDLGKRA